MGRVGAISLGVALVLSGNVRADDASRLNLAKTIVETAHVGETMRGLLPTFMAQMRQLITQQSPGDPKDVDVYVTRFQQRFGDDIPKFNELVASVYAREFSDEDLGSLLVFYQSSAGQHLLAKQSAIARSMVVLGQEWGKSVAQEILAEMAKEKAAKPSPKL